MIIWAQTSTLSKSMRPFKLVSHVTKITTITYNWVSSVVVNNLKLYAEQI
jgi:hypothetical protein